MGAAQGRRRRRGRRGARRLPRGAAHRRAARVAGDPERGGRAVAPPRPARPPRGRSGCPTRPRWGQLRAGRAAGEGRAAVPAEETSSEPRVAAWVDSHCHVHSADDADAQLDARARRGRRVDGVRRHRPRRRRSRRSTLAARHADVYATVGLHPHDASKLDAEWDDARRARARPSACVGDRRGRLRPLLRALAARRAGGRVPAPDPAREAARQAARDPLARRVGRHVPRARRRRRARRARSSTASPAVPTRRSARSTCGCYLSFSGIVSFKNGRRRCAPRPRIAPADRLLVETDAPYLAPDAVPRASRTSPRTSSRSAPRSAAARGVDVERDRRADARERGAGVRRRAVTPSRDPRAARRSTACARARRSASTSSPTRTPPRRIVRLAGRRARRPRRRGRARRRVADASRCADAGAHVLRGRARPASRCPCSRRSSASATSTIVAGDALTVDWPALLARPRPLGDGVEPAVQRRDAGRRARARRQRR